MQHMNAKSSVHKHSINVTSCKFYASCCYFVLLFEQSVYAELYACLANITVWVTNVHCFLLISL